MFRFGLIGYPLSHSISPRLHVAALKALGLPVEYNLYPLAPGEQFERGFAELLGKMRKNKLHGLNVTVPYKQNVMPYIDTLTPIAQASGAVNTIVYRGGGLIGANTDVTGFITDLETWLQELADKDAEVAQDSAPGAPGDAAVADPESPANVVGAKQSSSTGGQVLPSAKLRRALLLGAGGSARAVAYGLSQEGWQVTLAARRLHQAQELAEYMNGLKPAQPLQALLMDPLALAALQPDLLVNTTPLGMLPKIEGNPWPAALPLPAGALVYDLVYNPPASALLQQARAQGLPVRSGIGMLVEQAALALERWTGFHISRDAMRQAVPEFILP